MSEENQNEVDDISEDEQDENLEDDTEFSEEDELEKVKSENESLKKEIKNVNDKYLRLAAEYKNYQERSKKEKLSILLMQCHRFCQ